MERVKGIEPSSSAWKAVSLMPGTIDDASGPVTKSLFTHSDPSLDDATSLDAADRDPLHHALHQSSGSLVSSLHVREKHRLTAEHVRKALAMVAGKSVACRYIEWVDTRTQGLALRITPTAATWYLRTRTKTLRIGSAEILSVDHARDRADQARLDLAHGRNAKDAVETYESLIASGEDDIGAWEIADFAADLRCQSDEDRRANGPWRWRDLVEEFLVYKGKKLREGYVAQYESYLRHGAFDAIADKLVSDLTIADLEKVRNAIVKSNTVSAAWRSVQQGKEALSWAWKFHAGVSGLGACQFEWWTRWSIEYAPGTRDHVPTFADLARTLVVAETHRTLGGTEHETGPGTLGALWAVVLTGQRTGPLTGTKRVRLFADTDAARAAAGWSVANWDGKEMKGGKSGGRPHSLPIPPAALAVIEAYRKEAETEGEPASQFLFPSVRGKGHVSQTSLNQLLYRLQGKSNRPAPAKPKGKIRPRKRAFTAVPRENLFERYGIAPWTPHDARRALASFLDDRRLGGAASAILAHRPTKSEDEREKVEHVTRQHYAHNQRLALKAEGMAAWVEAVLDAYAEEKARLAGDKKAMAA